MVTTDWETGLRPGVAHDDEPAHEGAQQRWSAPADAPDHTAWCDDPLAAIALGVEELAGEEYRSWRAGSLSDRVREMGRVRERFEAEFVRLLAEWDRQRAWELDGALAPAGLLAFNTSASRPEASRSIRTARMVRDYAMTAEALASEAISVSQVSALARARAYGRDHLLHEHEPVLLEAAQAVDEDRFSTVVKQWMGMADDQLGRSSAHHIHENRYLHLHTTFAGAVVVDGRLDADAGSRLQAALERRVTPDPKDDPSPRTAAQLRADALIELVDDAESVTETTHRSRARTNVNVVVDLPTLQGEPWSPVSTAELVGIGPIARDTVARLLCDSYVTRVITNGPSQILDVGRSSRFVSEPQRAGLIVRDRGCVFPTCCRDHRWCDAHHLTPHAEIAKTDLHDLVLLCRRHHTLVHEGRWSIIRDPQTGIVDVSPPDPRAPARPPP